MKNIEAIFVGILALVVLGAAIFMVAGNGGWTSRPTPLPGPEYPNNGGPIVDASAGDVACQCFDQAFHLAGKDVGVMSSQYRTGFESCRAVAGVEGGDYWTAGWNARLSAKPFQATCRAYRNSRGV
jgi:hypothetical protein